MFNAIGITMANEINNIVIAVKTIVIYRKMMIDANSFVHQVFAVKQQVKQIIL
jgi:hypothetical protein